MEALSYFYSTLHTCFSLLQAVRRFCNGKYRDTIIKDIIVLIEILFLFLTHIFTFFIVIIYLLKLTFGTSSKTSHSILTIATKDMKFYLNWSYIYLVFAARCNLGYDEQNEWYFFSHKDRKYPTGTRTNRATAAGFWKATGRDKAVLSKNKVIGMRKTLVFYKGRAPNGRKSDWIMHEYRLQTSENGPPQASSIKFSLS